MGSMSGLEDALQKQIDLNSAKNLLHDRLEQVIEMDPAFLAVLEELLEDDSKTMGEICPTSRSSSKRCHLPPARSSNGCMRSTSFSRLMKRRGAAWNGSTRGRGRRSSTRETSMLC